MVAPTTVAKTTKSSGLKGSVDAVMFMNDISIVVRKMCTFAERGMAKEGVGFPEQVVLMYLSGQGPATQEQIASYFELDKGSVSKTLNKMEEKGLITREVNASDKRQKIVTPTRAANEVMAHMNEVLDSWNTQVYEGITEEEAAVLERCIAQMARNANNMLKGNR